MSSISADVLFINVQLGDLDYIYWFKFESLLTLCKKKPRSNTYNFILFSSDPIIHSTKSAWFWKAPIKWTNLQYAYNLWAESVKSTASEGLGIICHVTPWVKFFSVNSRVKARNMKWYLPLKIWRLIAVLTTNIIHLWQVFLHPFDE